jgi:hypothetical protein
MECARRGETRALYEITQGDPDYEEYCRDYQPWMLEDPDLIKDGVA